jgi:predicted TIM-barrel fold metal-dependent hydrolase
MKQGLRVIDSELHLEEPLDLWERKLPEPYRSRTRVTAPPEGHLRPGGTRVSFNGEPSPPQEGTSMIQRQAFRRWPDEPHLVKARTDCRPEVYLEGLDIEGVDVAILSPTMTISLTRHDELEPEHALALCRVYNDWAHEFTQGCPERFKFWGYVPPHDAELAAREARRCVRELGAVGIASIQGSINGHLWCDDYFNPLFEELSELKVPLGLHISFGGKVRDDFFSRYAGHRRTEVVANTLGLGAYFSHTTVAEFILGAVLERYPQLHLSIMESCVSWLPWLLWRMDEKWETFGPDAGYSLSLKPSEYWRRQCSAVMECEEDLGKYTIDFGGDHNLLFSTDYPHHDSPFPHGVDTFLGLQGISAESKRKILWDNGARLFGLAVPAHEALATAE